MVDFSFGQVEAVLAWQHDIADHKRTAFVSRLKHLQKNGLPVRDRPGRGKAGTFTFSQLLQLAIGVELIQSGVGPAQAARVVAGAWMTLRVTALFGATSQHDGLPTDWLWFIHPKALQELTCEGVSDYDQMEAVAAVPLSEATQYLREMQMLPKDGGRRVLIIDATRLISDLVHLISKTFKFASTVDMVGSLEEEVRQDEERLRSTVASIEATLGSRSETHTAEVLTNQLVRSLTSEPNTPRREATMLARKVLASLSDGARQFIIELPINNFMFAIDDQTRGCAKELIDHALIELPRTYSDEGWVDQVGEYRLTTLGSAVVVLSQSNGGADVDPQA